MADNVFFKAIEAHTHWKLRLRKHLDGVSDEHLDPDVICKDDQCTLGKWIYGEGTQFNNFDHYKELRKVHADFHLCAADIIRKTDYGQTEEAESIFGTLYSNLSRRITKCLVKMNSVVRKREVA